MGKSLDVIKQFHKAWNEKNIDEIGNLITENIKYEGPLLTWNNKNEYIEGAKQILPGFESIKILREFEDGDTVFAIEEIIFNTPDGKKIVELAEVYEIIDNKITKSKTYYDPRPIEKYCAPPQN